MNKIVLAVSITVICSFFTDLMSTAEASVHHKRHAHHGKSHSRHHKELSGNDQRSLVSWYGHEFHGKRTASGERYDMYAMTAAHRSLPLSSYAEVTNLKNNRSVIVRINDRGPFHGRRVMDLSYSAAKELGIRGMGSVKITPLGSNGQTISELINRNKADKNG